MTKIKAKKISLEDKAKIKDLDGLLNWDEALGHSENFLNSHNDSDQLASGYKPRMNCSINLKGINTGSLSIDSVCICFEYQSFNELSEGVQKQYFDLLEKLSKNII